MRGQISGWIKRCACVVHGVEGAGGPNGGGDTPFVPTDETRGLIVDAALALAETQLLAQVADDASLDGRATGLIGFNGALLAASIAAKELLKLGRFWPVPIAVMVASTLMLLWALYGGASSP
jgi:hypothetical protein